MSNEFTNLSCEEQQVIRKMRAENAKKQAAAYPIRSAEEIPIEEKIVGFDKLYAQALLVWVKHRDDGYYTTDEKQWAFESLMNLLINPVSRESNADYIAFWKAFNTLGQGAV